MALKFLLDKIIVGDKYRNFEKGNKPEEN